MGQFHRWLTTHLETAPPPDPLTHLWNDRAESVLHRIGEHSESGFSYGDTHAVAAKHL
jgi:hypothetical protein